MSKYRLHMDMHTHIYCLTCRQACALSVTLFFVTCQLFFTSLLRYLPLTGDNTDYRMNRR